MSEPDPALKAALIRVVAARSDTAAASDIIGLTAHADPAVRSEAFQAIGVLGDPSHVVELAKAFKNTKDAADRIAAQGAIQKIFSRTTAADKCAAPLIDIYATCDKAGQTAILPMLGQFGSGKSIDILRAAIGADDEEIRNAGVRALADWPDASVMDEVKAIANNTNNLVQHVLAMRGYVRMIGLTSGRSAEETAKLYVEAWDMSTRVDEKKLVLGGIASVNCAMAFDLACKGLDEPGCAAEAATAVINTVDAGMKSADPATVRAALDKAMKATGNRRLREKAESLLKELENKGN